MNSYQRQKQGQQFAGWAFTFCKAAFLVLIFGRYALLALSGLATLFYLLAAARGVREWRSSGAWFSCGKHGRSS